jgi:hypothetical protein
MTLGRRITDVSSEHKPHKLFGHFAGVKTHPRKGVRSIQIFDFY